VQKAAETTAKGSTIRQIVQRVSQNERRRRRMLEGNLAVAVARFGAPLVVGMALHTMFNLVDMFMISRLENASESLAALGICDMIAAVATIISTGISTATVARISRAVGARDLRGIRRATWQSLWLVSAFSLGFGVLGLAGSEAIIRVLMQAKGETAALAVPYLRIMLGGCYSIFLLLQITAILRALGNAKSAAFLLIFGNALNIILNIFLVYGDGHRPSFFAFAAPLAHALHVPRMGIVGAAWATLIGRTVPVVLGAWMLARRKGGPRFHPIYLRPLGPELRAILKVGWPSSAQFVARILSILVFLSLVNANFTSVGDPSALTAYSICLRLETMALFIGMGWGAAASSFVGANLGAGQRMRAKNAGWIAAFYNVLLMLGLAAFYLVHGDILVGFFDNAPSVIAIGREYLKIVSLSYLFLGLGVVLSQAMTGAGATLSSLVIDTIILFGFVVPSAIFVAETLDGSRTLLWTIIALGNVASAVAFAAWYMRGSFLGKPNAAALGNSPIN